MYVGEYRLAARLCRGQQRAREIDIAQAIGVGVIREDIGRGAELLHILEIGIDLTAAGRVIQNNALRSLAAVEETRMRYSRGAVRDSAAGGVIGGV